MSKLKVVDSLIKDLLKKIDDDTIDWVYEKKNL